MADQDLAVMNDEQRREAAKQDAHVLAEADLIRQNTERFELAKMVAAEMALESADQARIFSSIASSALNYPQMDKERAEGQSIAPSAGG